jgi:hypothetical protein
MQIVDPPSIIFAHFEKKSRQGGDGACGSNDTTPLGKNGFLLSGFPEIASKPTEYLLDVLLLPGLIRPLFTEGNNSERIALLKEDLPALPEDKFRTPPTEIENQATLRAGIQVGEHTESAEPGFLLSVNDFQEESRSGADQFGEGISVNCPAQRLGPHCPATGNTCL